MIIYGLYDDNNNLIFKGSSSEVADKFGFRVKDVSTYAGRGTKMGRLYFVKKLTEIEKKGPAQRMIFGLFENGKLVDKGEAKEIANKYHTSINQLTTYAYTSNKYLGKYLVRKVLKTKESLKEMQDRINKEIFNENLEYLITNLKIYGNTIFTEDINEYIPELKKNGFDPKITLKTDFDLRGKKERHWLLEL